MFIKIEEIQPKPDFTAVVSFSNGVLRDIDFKQFIGADKLSSPLKNYNYFVQVKAYPNGRGLYWPNDFDICADYLYGLG